MHKQFLAEDTVQAFGIMLLLRSAITSHNFHLIIYTDFFSLHRNYCPRIYPMIWNGNVDVILKLY